MPGGVDQSGPGTGAKDRRVVAAAGAVTDPHFRDRQFLHRRHRVPRRFEQHQHATGSETRRQSLDRARPSADRQHNRIGRDFGSVGQRHRARTLAGNHDAAHTLLFADGDPCRRAQLVHR
jgi:hypothetical protein